MKYAKANDYRVRCAGYRHSWSPTFSEDRQILVSLLNLKQVDTLPDPSSIQPTPLSNKDNELKSIELAAENVQGTTNKRWVRVGVAVTNEDFRRWALENGAWAMPVDVVLVEYIS